MKAILFKSKQKIIPKDTPKFVTKETNGYLEFKGVLRAPKEVLPTNKMDTFRQGIVINKRELDLNKLSEVNVVQERKRVDPKEFIIEVEDFSLDFLEEVPEKPKIVRPEKPEKPNVKPVESKLNIIKPMDSKVSIVEKFKALFKGKPKKPKQPKKPRVTKKPKKPKVTMKPKEPREPRKTKKPKDRKVGIKTKRDVTPKDQKRVEAIVNDNSSINNLLNSETYGIKDRGIINKHEKIGGGEDSE